MQHEVTIVDSGLPYRNGVGLCIFNADGLVLCAERRDKRGAWQMPQGGIQKGEDPTFAVFREMKEEVGTDKADIIARHPDRLRYDFPDALQYRNGVFHGKYRGQEQVWFALLYHGADADINLTSEYESEAPEFVSWRWFSLVETPSLIVDFKRPVYESVVEVFSPFSQRLAQGQDVPPL